MKLTTAVRAELHARMQKLEINQPTLARALRISQPNVNQLLRGKRLAQQLDKWQAVSRALGWPLSELIARAEKLCATEGRKIGEDQGVMPHSPTVEATPNDPLLRSAAAGLPPEWRDELAALVGDFIAQHAHELAPNHRSAADPRPRRSGPGRRLRPSRRKGA